jgi:hypothetical protein
MRFFSESKEDMKADNGQKCVMGYPTLGPDVLKTTACQGID